MAMLTKYGTLWGAVPMTAGQVIWVAPSASYTVDGRAYNASDDNDGLSPERAKLTISSAIGAATANVGDVIALLPGTHSSAAAAASKAGVTFVGLPYYPESNDSTPAIPQAIVTGTTGAAIAVTGADVAFYNIKFVPITAQSAVTFTTAANRLRFKHCVVDFTGVTGHASTKGIVATGATQAPRGIRFDGCFFKAGNATTSCGPAIDVGAATDFIINRCTVYHDGAVASVTAWLVAIKMNDNCQGMIRDSDFIANALGGAGVTKFVEAAALTGTSVVQAFGNRASVNTGGLLLDDFAAADVELCNNYIATVAGGTGGTLITATT